MVTTMEVLMASPIGEELVEYVKEEGRQEGRQEGHLEGRLAEARRGLRRLADARFPGLLEASRADAKQTRRHPPPEHHLNDETSAKHRSRCQEYARE